MGRPEGVRVVLDLEGEKRGLMICVRRVWRVEGNREGTGRWGGGLEVSEDGCCSLMEGIDLGRGGWVVGWEGDVEDGS